MLLFSYESNSGGEREIQRTMLELLNQLDGFDSRGDVKVQELPFFSERIKIFYMNWLGYYGNKSNW